MSQAKQLYALQGIDLELEKQKQTLSQVESQIGESEACKQTQAKLEEEQKQQADLGSKQKELGWKLDERQGKISQSSNKLYGGNIRNPRELTSLQEEIAQLKAQQSQSEDKYLEILVQLESAQERIKLLSQELKRLLAEWQQNQQQLTDQQSQLRSAIDQLSEKRQAMIDGLSPATAELYETLRRGKQGKAIAKVEQGRCQGCRLTLSVTDLRRVRASNELVYCSSCGRILFLD